jgi:uncharacterized membrane protein YkoI
MPFLGAGPILRSGSPTKEGINMKNRVKHLFMGVAALAAAALGGATVASAVSNGSGETQTTETAAADDTAMDSSRAGRAGHARGDETALTGDTATKVKDAALAKTGGGTVERVETDGDGHAAYEAHVLKSDGTRVTVYVNKQFEVVGTESRR